MKLLLEEYAEELRILGVTLPKTEQIPMVRFDRAKELVAENTTGRYAIRMTWSRRRNP